MSVQAPRQRALNSSLLGRRHRQQTHDPSNQTRARVIRADFKFGQSGPKARAFGYCWQVQGPGQWTQAPR